MTCLDGLQLKFHSDIGKVTVNMDRSNKSDHPTILAVSQQILYK